MRLLSRCLTKTHQGKICYEDPMRKKRGTKIVFVNQALRLRVLVPRKKRSCNRPPQKTFLSFSVPQQRRQEYFMAYKHTSITSYLSVLVHHRII